MANLSYSKFLVLLFMIFELIVISIHMFSQGFLLTRDALSNKSKCNDFHLPCNEHRISASQNGCWIPKRFNKTILLIVDALRYDFALYDKSVKRSEEKFYQNKLQIFDDIISKYPKQAKLMPFIADPPTTTMQRLKGITTGSLPTFIDASHNFASVEILEDNLLDQLNENGLKIVALGDDTWGEIYPKRFHRSFLFPSFNVMDLDSVDNGILQHLYSEIKLPDWNLIIAHFLGVDHCGHRYGPSHFQMETKLKQMDQVIRNVSANLENDTLLVVIGDHGMTSTGDHGGDSKEEIEAALFFYSPGFSFDEWGTSKPVPFVSQIDLVPTLALLMGVPIPFSSLGKVIEEMLDLNIKSNCFLNDALTLNMKQVNHYLHSYKKVNEEFPQNYWEKLEHIAAANFSYEKVSSQEKQLMIEYLNQARIMCEEIWAKFNLLNMFSGISSLICVLISAFNVLPTNLSGQKPSSLQFRFVLCLFLIVNIIYGLSLFFFQKKFHFLVGLTLVCFSGLFFKSFSWTRPSGWSPFSVATVVLLSTGTFSNSFVIVEDYVSSFFVLSHVIFMVASFYLRKFNFLSKCKSQRQSYFFAFHDVIMVGCVVVVFICVRISKMFWKCREEQYWCESPTLVHIPLSGLPREFHNARYFTSLVPLIAIILVPQKWLQSCGNLNGWEVGIIVAKTIPIICGVLTGSYWALLSTSVKVGETLKIAIYLPRVIYFVGGLGILFLYYNPLFVYILPPTKEVIGPSSDSLVIPKLYKKLREKYEQHSSYSDASKTPIVYGLATALSAPLIMLLVLVTLILMIIAGDGMTPGILLLVVTATSFIIFHSCLTWKKASSVDFLLKPSWVSIALWFLLSIQGFYATGHQPTFPTLNWSAAFVGYDGKGSYVIPALLVIVNTFSSQLLFGLALPLIFIVPLSVGFLWPSLRFNNIGEEANRGEFLLVERPRQARESLLSCAIVYITFHSFKVLFTSMASFILRRHLMVWKIFGPHFIFEAVGLIVSCIGVFIGLTFVFRVLSSLESWSKKL